MSGPYYSDGSVTLHHGDCLDVLRSLPDASVDAVVTDPPYGLEFMGKGWDAPWRESDVNADAGMSATGYTDGGNRLPRPSFTGSTNPKCLACKGTRRGRRDGTAKVAVCLCEDGGRFPNVRAIEMRAFAEWCETWTTELYRVLKPGGHMLAFGGTRTFHRLACAVEDAGFEVRDSIAWLYGSGFPKSLDVSKAIDKAAGAERPILGHEARDYTQNRVSDMPSDSELFGERARLRPITEAQTPDAERWQGWGTALKPAFEPIVVARKPLTGTVAANVLTHGTGALNIDGCRIDGVRHAGGASATNIYGSAQDYTPGPNVPGNPAGRWPANVVLDESQAEVLDVQSGETQSKRANRGSDGGIFRLHGFSSPDELAVAAARGDKCPDGRDARETYRRYLESAENDNIRGVDDRGGASRFFYVAKAGADERVRVNGTAHPTVKPLALMRWLVRLVTPPGGTVLEPFAGSGTTVEACILEGFQCVAIEREPDYLPLIVQRINRRRDPVAAVRGTGEDGGLFDLLGEETA